MTVQCSVMEVFRISVQVEKPMLKGNTLLVKIVVRNSEGSLYSPMDVLPCTVHLVAGDGTVGASFETIQAHRVSDGVFHGYLRTSGTGYSGDSFLLRGVFSDAPDRTTTFQTHFRTEVISDVIP